MNKVVSLSIVRQDHQVSIEEAWARFVAAKEQSEKTLAVEDGIAAGKAYREFCEMFLRRAS